MRHVVYLLLVVNLLYLGWNLSRTGIGADHTASWPPLPDSAVPLVTLKEMQQQTDATAGLAEPDGLTRAEPPGAGQVECQALGPFSLPDEVRAVASRLDELGLDPHERIASVREENGYWVYLPAMEPDAASKVIKLLEQHGDTDYFLGRDKYLALGTFTDIKRAERRLAQLRKLGLDAILAKRYAERDAWWLEFRKPAENMLGNILEQHPELQLHPLACL